MKNVALLFIAFMLSVSVSYADEVFDRFASKLSSSHVRVSYVMSVNGKDSDAGVAEACGKSYRLENEGYEVISDGNSVWTVDRKAREVVIENAPDQPSASNPAGLIMGLTSSFKVSGSGDIVRGGGKYHYVTLSPLKQAGIASVKLLFRGDSLVSAAAAMQDGTELDFEFPQVKFLDGNEVFSFDAKSLDSSWTVTDMRDF